MVDKDEALRSVTASLVAAVSLLARAEAIGKKPSAATGSRSMFRQMIKDYDKSITQGRLAILGDK